MTTQALRKRRDYIIEHWEGAAQKWAVDASPGGVKCLALHFLHDSQEFKRHFDLPNGVPSLDSSYYWFSAPIGAILMLIEIGILEKGGRL